MKIYIIHEKDICLRIQGDAKPIAFGQIFFSVEVAHGVESQSDSDVTNLSVELVQFPLSLGKAAAEIVAWLKGSSAAMWAGALAFLEPADGVRHLPVAYGTGDRDGHRI